VAILAIELLRELLLFFKFSVMSSFLLVKSELCLRGEGFNDLSLEAEVILNLGEILGNVTSHVLRISIIFDAIE